MWEMVIMVENFYKVSEKENSETVEVREMVTQEKVHIIQEGKSPVKMIGVSVMPFQARARHSLLTQ